MDIVLLISGERRAAMGSLTPGPGLDPFPAPEKELYLHNWVPFSLCVLKWAFWKQEARGSLERRA